MSDTAADPSRLLCRNCGMPGDLFTLVGPEGDEHECIGCPGCMATIAGRLDSVRPITAAMRAAGVPEAILQETMLGLMHRLDEVRAWPLRRPA